MKSCSKSCVFLFFLVVADSVHSSLEESTDDILQFLALSEEKMVLDPKHKDVVLVFGNTGAGKTSFIQWIAGDDSKLNSVEQIPGNFILVDNNRIGNSTVQSKTTFPELVVDKETGTAYYDFSGFGDTRGIKNDLATSYFIKRVIDHVDKVKILLVTDYEAVRVGGSRKDFLKLLQHIVELIKNTDKYLPGMGLVVTKVDNSYSKGKLVCDDTIIMGIVDFLDDVRAQTAQKIDLDDDDRSKITNLILNIISENNVNENSDLIKNKTKGKIMIFRKPNDTGPLSAIPLLQQAKLRARTAISEHLKFISKRNEDFSYTVSAETKYKLHNLIDVLKEKLVENVQTIAHNMENNYENKINITEKNTQIIDIFDIEKTESGLIKAQNLEKEVNDGIKNVVTLASDIKNTKRCKDIAVILQNAVNKSNVTIPPQIMLNVLSAANFLEFVDEASILKLTYDATLLQLPFQETAKKLNAGFRTLCVRRASNIQVKQSIDRLSISLEENIKNNFKNALTHLKKYIIAKIEKTSLNLAEVKTIINFYSREVKINKLNDMFKMSQTKISSLVLQKFKDPNYDKFFMTELNLLVQSLNNLHTWYNFLEKLYNELSSYNVQNSNAVLSRCKSFIQSKSNYRGRIVRDIDFILQDCSKNLYDAEFDKIKNVNLTEYDVELLKNVVDFALNDNNLSHHCSDLKLVVKGRFVKLSEINLNMCNGMSVFEVIALEKVFFDRNFDFTGLNITIIIMAPHWVVLGDRKIILDGKPGELSQPIKAKQGKNGIPGMPGGNAGNFLGYGDQIINSEKLFISANGGHGGPGQAGGDGKPGIDGAIPEIPPTSDSEETSPDSLNDYWKEQKFTVSRSELWTCDFPYASCKEYEVTGTSCSDGGDGGRGGVGGEGGAAGLVQAPYGKGLKVSAKKGSYGASGLPGTGGEAGHPSATIYVTEKNKIISYRGAIFSFLYYEKIKTLYHSCSSGWTPHRYYNSLGRVRSSQVSHYVLNLKMCLAFDDFKAYVQQNINKTLRKQYLLNILEQARQQAGKLISFTS